MSDMIMTDNKADGGAIKDKFRDAVYGAALGDALGVPYEFKRRGAFNCTGMTGYKTHYQPPGTWSDDTSMILATAKSIKDNGGKIVISDIYENFCKWYFYEMFTATGEVFDYGIATGKALKSGEPGCGPRDSNA